VFTGVRRADACRADGIVCAIQGTSIAVAIYRVGGVIGLRADIAMRLYQGVRPRSGHNCVVTLALLTIVAAASVVAASPGTARDVTRPPPG
jgi:hypothetical protein